MTFLELRKLAQSYMWGQTDRRTGTETDSFLSVENTRHEIVCSYFDSARNLGDNYEAVSPIHSNNVGDNY